VKPKIIVFLLLITSYSAIAQLTYEKRIEIELKDDYLGETIYQFGEDGFILRSYRINIPGKKNEWKYDLYNTDLEVAKTLKMKLDSRLYEDETFKNDSMLHTLYKDKNGKFSLVSIRAKDLKKTIVEGVLPRNSTVTDLAILGDFAYLNANIKKERFLFSINWKTGKKHMMPIQIEGYKSKNIILDGFQLIQESNEIFLYVKAYGRKMEYKFFIVKLNNKGEKEDMFDFSANFIQKIVSVTTYKLNEKEYIYTGTFSKTGSGATGIFFCKGNNGNIESTNLVNFSDMDISQIDREAKINEKSKKGSKRRNNKKTTTVYTNLVLHEIIPVENGYFFLGEAFHPTYSTEPYTVTTMIAGNTETVTRYRTVFAGYQYTYAILAKFDLEGDLDWDKRFSLFPFYKTRYVRKYVSIAKSDDNAVKLVFASDNRIYSKTLGADGTVINYTESEEIETGYSSDKIEYSFSKADYWYGNYFLAYGSQRIKNKGNKEAKRKREVFFISKIKY
jgi:hypothetical protein